MTDLVISPLTRHLLELFDGPLREVRFPDADVDRLSRVVEEAETAHEALVRAELAVSAAREALADKRRAVDKQTERTVAYAKIYAADQPELLASIETLAAPPRRGRGRPRKDGTTSPMTSQASPTPQRRASRASKANSDAGISHEDASHDDVTHGADEAHAAE